MLGADSTVRKSWKVSFPALHQGQCGDVVVGFKKAMRKMGYIANSGSCFGGKTARGVLAYRKVNDMTRSMRAGAGLVKSVFGGKGDYKVRHPEAGEHVEAPLSKQVLVFTKGDKPFAIYPISSGKSSTPTVTGHYTFIRIEPGYNSHGMYYSFYFYGGYAVHGYESVPDYPASHGCLRTFIADQPEIYEPHPLRRGHLRLVAMRVFVAGASGAIGRPLVRQLLAARARGDGDDPAPGAGGGDS